MMRLDLIPSRVPSLLVLSVFLVSLAVGQSTTGVLEGWVLDGEGVGVAGATIAVASPALPGERYATTDARGHFRVLALPPGSYRTTIRHLAFSPRTITGTTVSLGSTVSLGKVELRSNTLEAGEVVVTGQGSLIDPRSATVGTNLAFDRLESLPLDRSYQTIPQYLPHANPSFYGDGINVAGGTGLENKYYLNGVDVTDPFRGVGATNLPYNFIREVQVKTGAYDAEFRGSLGGSLNVLTYSGGNETRGQVFGFHTSNSFSAAPRYAIGQAPKQDYAQYDVGVSLGGAVLTDQLWYFLAFNQKQINEDVMIPGQGVHPDRASTSMFAGKVTWNADPNNLLIFTLTGDPGKREGVGVRLNGPMRIVDSLVNPDPWLVTVRTGGVAVSLAGTHQLGKGWLLETAVSIVTRMDDFQPSTQAGHEFAFLDTETNILSGGYLEPSYEFTRQFVASVKATVTFGDHTAKAGIEYIGISMESDYKTRMIERYSDSSYVRYDYSILGTIKHRLPSVFVQDSWQVSPEFCVNAGVRWDPQYMYDSEGALAQKIEDQVQPRLSIVYQPGELGIGKIMASYGRFYQPVHLSLSEMYHNKQVIWKFEEFTHDPRVDPTGGVPGMGSDPYLTNVAGLKGQGYDEVTLGYEHAFTPAFKVGIRGIYRTLVQAIEDGADLATRNWVYGNPGSGLMANYTRATREYAALELSLESLSDLGWNVMATYVLSRNRGNYTGLAQTDVRFLAFPNNTNQYDIPELSQNATGLLSNDRTHALKVLSWYRFDWGLTLGGVLTWTSGTPLSEMGGSTFGPPEYIFLQTRGSVGRTPAIVDLNLRVVYEFLRDIRFVLDVFHVASPRTAVQVDQLHYYEQDTNGIQISPNPNYGKDIQFAPPMSARIGLEIRF